MDPKMVHKVALAAFLAAILPASAALADDNTGGELAPMDAAVGSLRPNFGNAVCTAAINSTGTVAGGASVNLNALETRRLGVGNYEVDFRNPCQDVRAVSGFARHIQIDTLTSGSAPPIVCTTADRAGDISSVWVVCYDLTGAPADTSFFLTITR